MGQIQQWLVRAPLGIHLEPINKELMLLVTLFTVPSTPKSSFAQVPMVCHTCMSLSKTPNYISDHKLNNINSSDFTVFIDHKYQEPMEKPYSFFIGSCKY